MKLIQGTLFHIKVIQKSLYALLCSDHTTGIKREGVRST